MTSHNLITSISTKQNNPHHEVNSTTKTIFKQSLTSNFKFNFKILIIFIFIYLNLTTFRETSSTSRRTKEKREGIHPEHHHHNQRKEEMRSPKTGTKGVRLLAVPSCSTFSQVAKKEDVAHTGEVWVAGPKAEGTGQRRLLCVLCLDSSLPFEQNDVRASTTFSGHSA